MKAVVQRVDRASVRVDGVVRGEIGAGLLVLLGVAVGDGSEEAERLAGKIARLRIFGNDEGRFDRSLLDMGGAALVVSQFTLLGDTREGEPAELHRCGAAGARGAALRARSARHFARSASTSRRASSAPACRSSSSTTGPVTLVLDV